MHSPSIIVGVHIYVTYTYISGESPPIGAHRNTYLPNSVSHTDIKGHSIRVALLPNTVPMFTANYSWHNFFRHTLSSQIDISGTPLWLIKGGPPPQSYLPLTHKKAHTHTSTVVVRLKCGVCSYSSSRR